MKANREIRMLLVAGIVAGGMGVPVIAAADNAPQPSYVAAPGVYKVLAENEKFRVIRATWKPGQRDEWHSHLPGAVYVVNDCGTHRTHTPDGKSIDKPRKAGDVIVIGTIPSHAVENTGTTDCIQIIFEPK